MTMNRWKTVVSTPTINLLSAQTPSQQSSGLSRQLSSGKGGRNQGGNKSGGRRWRSAGAATAASAAVLAFKLSQEKDR